MRCQGVKTFKMFLTRVSATKPYKGFDSQKCQLSKKWVLTVDRTVSKTLIRVLTVLVSKPLYI